jgi:hypothetical protein
VRARNATQQHQQQCDNYGELVNHAKYRKNTLISAKLCFRFPLQLSRCVGGRSGGGGGGGGVVFRSRSLHFFFRYHM